MSIDEIRAKRYQEMREEVAEREFKRLITAGTSATLTWFDPQACEILTKSAFVDQDSPFYGMTSDLPDN